MFNQGIHWSPNADFAFNYEEMFVATMVARGFAIFMPDYEGLGTIGVMHTYVNRLSEGHAMLDGARAAMQLPDTSLDHHGPVAFWGYSQGGARGGLGGGTGRELRPGRASSGPTPAPRRPTSS
jgi:triacylglycerol lipase